MENVKANNVSADQVEHYLSKCDVLPRNFNIITTINTVAEEDDLILIEDEDDSMMSEWQYVIAVGKGIEGNWLVPGDKVLIDLTKLVMRVPNPENRMEMVESYNIKPVQIDDKYFNIVSESAVLAKKHNYEDIEL